MQRTLARGTSRRVSTGFIVMASSVALVACSDGGGPTDEETLSVSRVIVGTPKYGQTLLFTVEGTKLDDSLRVTAPACTGLQRSTTPPSVSSATQGFYTCVATTVGDSTVTVANSAGTQLGSASFSVPLPQATFVVASSAGLSGNLVLTLDPSKARATVDNFLRYVNDGFYAGTVIHRVVPGFVVQGGGYLAASAPGAPVLKTPRPPIALETSGGLSNIRLSVAMARGPAADSATSQFFINLADNSGTLDATSTFAGYAVFGSLTAGQDVLALITAAPCSPIPGFSECAPSPEIVIASASQTR